MFTATEKAAGMSKDFLGKQQALRIIQILYQPG
jgi:hypothetical protein